VTAEYETQPFSQAPDAEAQCRGEVSGGAPRLGRVWWLRQVDDWEIDRLTFTLG
jgi:hypothetical protein